MAGGEQAGIVFPGLYAESREQGARGKGEVAHGLCSARVAYHLKQRSRQQQQQKKTLDPDKNKAKVMVSH